MVQNVLGGAELNARLLGGAPDGPISRINQANELFSLLNEK